MRDRDGTLVFVEVRSRGSGDFGGAAASISVAKQRSLVLAARHYLSRLRTPPACRFDVVAINGDRFEWLRAAFDAGQLLHSTEPVWCICCHMIHAHA